MKKFTLSIMGLMLLGVMACNKTNNNKSAATDATDDAADLVASALAVNTGGSFSSINDITTGAQAKVNVDTLCGTTWTDSITVASTVGQIITFNYKAKYNYTINCPTGPASGYFNGTVTGAGSYTGIYSGPYISSNHSGSSDFTVAGLGRTNAFYTVNGEYKRNGAFQSKVDTSYEGNHNIDVIITNLIITKPLRIIKSGNATITATVVTPKRGTLNYTGSVVFTGGDQATLTLNGRVYLVNLLTGTKVRRQ